LSGGDHGNEVVTYGGLGREPFIMMLERGAPMINNVMHAKVKDIQYHRLSMIMPKNEQLIGNVRTPCYHGGALATMIDHVAGFCAWASLPDSFHRVSTVNLSVDYLHPPPVEDLIFEAKIEHKTNRLARVSCVVWDSQHKRKIALGKGLFNIYEVKEDLAQLLVTAMKYQHAKSSQSTPSSSPSSS
jgi:uncharacterized protein (TIGR00369 family)